MLLRVGRACPLNVRHSPPLGLSSDVFAPSRAITTFASHDKRVVAASRCLLLLLLPHPQSRWIRKRIPKVRGCSLLFRVLFEFSVLFFFLIPPSALCRFFSLRFLSSSLINFTPIQTRVLSQYHFPIPFHSFLNIPCIFS